MKKNQIHLQSAKLLSAKQMKEITGGIGTAALLYYCNLNLGTSCIPYNSRSACVASGCPSTKCSTKTLCIE
jgi:hypothetical protein